MRNIRGLTLDIGGSELRAKPYGLAEKTCIPNECATILQENFRFKPTDDPIGCCEIIEAPRKEYEGYIAVGSVGRSYPSENIALSTGEPKTAQGNYYKQMLYMIAREALAESERCGFNTVSPQVDRIGYVLSVCIPIREHSGREDCSSKLKSKLVGDYVVRFPLFESPRYVRFTLKSSWIGVVPEGGVAMTALRKSVDQDTLSLIIDVGEVTTDIALFKGKSLYGDKVVSVSWAGRTLSSNIRMALNDAGYVLAQSDVQDVIKTGRVRLGVDEVSVVEIIQAEKKNFVRNYLQEEILNLLNANKIIPTQIHNVIPIGAVMNASAGMPPLYDYILDDCNLRFAKVYELADDLRYVNISQAETYTELLLRAARED